MIPQTHLGKRPPLLGRSATNVNISSHYHAVLLPFFSLPLSSLLVVTMAWSWLELLLMTQRQSSSRRYSKQKWEGLGDCWQPLNLLLWVWSLIHPSTVAPPSRHRPVLHSPNTWWSGICNEIVCMYTHLLVITIVACENFPSLNLISHNILFI